MTTCDLKTHCRFCRLFLNGCLPTDIVDDVTEAQEKARGVYDGILGKNISLSEIAFYNFFAVRNSVRVMECDLTMDERYKRDLVWCTGEQLNKFAYEYMSPEQIMDIVYDSEDERIMPDLAVVYKLLHKSFNHNGFFTDAVVHFGKIVADEMMKASRDDGFILVCEKEDAKTIPEIEGITVMPLITLHSAYKVFYVTKSHDCVVDYLAPVTLMHTGEIEFRVQIQKSYYTKVASELSKTILKSMPNMKFDGAEEKIDEFVESGDMDEIYDAAASMMAEASSGKLVLNERTVPPIDPTLDIIAGLVKSDINSFVLVYLFRIIPRFFPLDQMEIIYDNEATATLKKIQAQIGTGVIVRDLTNEHAKILSDNIAKFLNIVLQNIYKKENAEYNVVKFAKKMMIINTKFMASKYAKEYKEKMLAILKFANLGIVAKNFKDWVMTPKQIVISDMVASLCDLFKYVAMKFYSMTKTTGKLMITPLQCIVWNKKIPEIDYARGKLNYYNLISKILGSNKYLVCYNGRKFESTKFSIKSVL